MADPGMHWSSREMFEQASRAVGRVIRDDVRGMTKLSIDDIASMAGALLALGLVSTPPGENPPQTLIYSFEKEPSNGQ